MEYQLVLQFEAKSMESFDRLVIFEEKLAAQLGSLATVDGHDFGREEFNIFLLTDEPKVAFERAHQFLKTQDVPNYMRAAYREATGEDYAVLWPPNGPTTSGHAQQFQLKQPTQVDPTKFKKTGGS